MKKNSIALLLVLLVTVIGACSNSPPNQVSDSSTQSPTSDQPDITNSETILTDEEKEMLDEYTFLTSLDGYDYQRAVSKFAIAYLSGDTATVESFYLDDFKSDYKYYPEGYTFSDVEFMVLKFYGFDINKLEARVQYEFKKKGTDYYQYLDIVMIQINEEWKVKSFFQDA